MVLHFQTFFANAVGPILRQLDVTLLKHATRSASRVLLFSIAPSATLPADDLSQLVSYFQALKHERVGGIFAPMANVGESGLDFTGTWCSLAIFDRKAATPFRSNIPGRAAAQVGRWHASRKMQEPRTDLPRSLGQGLWSWDAPSYALPEGLQTLRPEDVHNVIYFSDNAPEGLANSLTVAFKNASQAGIIASSTPFITGRPFTLFHNADILSGGAVGLCLSPTGQTEESIHFPPELEQLTGDLVVTQSEGNLIHSLNDKNPSKILLDTIKSDPRLRIDHASQKFYLGIHDGSKFLQMYTILSGDPSRGSIALEGECAPDKGNTVRLYWLPPRHGAYSVSFPSKGVKMMEFFSMNPGDSFTTAGNMNPGEACGTYENKFQACSENGLITSSPSPSGFMRPWRISIPGVHLLEVW